MYDLLPNGVNLCKWKMIKSSDCCFCNVKNDIFHMFIECQRVKLFWKEFEHFLMSNYNCNVKLTMNILFCGLENCSKEINLLLIIAMFTIYKSWMMYKDSEDFHKINVFDLFLVELRIRKENERVFLLSK